MLLVRTTAAGLLGCVILLTRVHFVQSKDCANQTFGSRCQFRCHCNGEECDSTSGECKAGSSCTKGFFGRACQYVNLVTNSTKSPAWLTDDNPNTCNNYNSSKKGLIYVELQHRIRFSFIRMHLKAGYVSNATIKLLIDQAGPCLQIQQYMIRTRVMEVTCQIDALVTSFEIDGDVVDNLCGVEVSGGRRLSYVGTMYYSAGNKTTSVCQPTALSNDLVITFIADGPQLVFTLSVTVEREVLKSFTFQCGSYAYNVNPTYYNSSLKRFFYDVYEEKAVKNVTFSNFVGTGNIDFCNKDTVKIMGDSMCNSNKRGFSCEENCACQFDQLCNMEGMCVRGCEQGYYGHLCSRTCGEGCLGHSCEYTTGLCNCSEGYHADGMCYLQCGDGTYGLGCSKLCSPLCNGQCDVMTGHCKSCDTRLFGSFCQFRCNAGCESGLCHKETGHCLMCPETKFGYSCDHDCPLSCLNDICNVTTGSCFTCKTGFYGVIPCVNGTITKNSLIPDDFMLDFANPCVERFVHCYAACSPGCEDKYCDKQRGSCTCLPDYRGTACDEHSSERPEIIWMVLFSLPFISLCAIVFFCFPKKKHKPSVETGIRATKSAATVNSSPRSVVSTTASTSID